MKKLYTLLIALCISIPSLISQGIDWDNYNTNIPGGWPAGATTFTANTLSGAFQFQILDPSNALTDIFYQTGTALATPRVDKYYEFPANIVDNSMIVHGDALTMGPLNSLITIIIDCGNPGVGIGNLQFNILDVDGVANPNATLQEFVKVAGFIGSTTIIPFLSGSQTNHVISGHVVTGIQSCAHQTQYIDPSNYPLNPADGVVNVQFNTPVDKIIIELGIDNYRILNREFNPSIAIADFKAPLTLATQISNFSITNTAEGHHISATINSDSANEIYLQKSTDQVNFETIASHLFPGEIDYVYGLAEETESQLYYRFLIYHDDGTFTVSPIQKAAVPNHNQTEVVLRNKTLYINGEGINHLEIFNAAGQSMLKQKLTSGETSISLDDLIPGVYFVKTNTNKPTRIVIN